ncbi:MAG: hypothetical protein WBP22_03495 [Candidatus Saccharimonas sp.]
MVVRTFQSVHYDREASVQFFANFQPDIDSTGFGRVTLGYTPPAIGISRVHEQHKSAFDRLLIEDFANILSLKSVLCFQIKGAPLCFTTYHEQKANQVEIAASMVALLQKSFGASITIRISGVHYDQWRADQFMTEWLRRTIHTRQPPAKFVDEIHSSVRTNGSYTYWPTNGRLVSETLSHAVRTPVVRPSIRLRDLRRRTNTIPRLLKNTQVAHPA